MVRRLTLASLLAGLWIAGQALAVAAYDGAEVRYERSTLDEIRTTISGRQPAPRPFPSSGFISDGRPFRIQYTDVVLTSFDMPRLLSIVEDSAQLPPDSRIEIEGRMDREPFHVLIERSPAGRTTANLDGLVFRDRFEAMDLLDGLTHRGVAHARLEGRIGDRRIVARVDNGMRRFEG